MHTRAVAGILMLVISCGGSPKPATPVHNEPATTPPPVLPAEPEPIAKQPDPPPPPPAPAPPPKKPVYELLHDTDGEIAGLAAISIARKPDPMHCGGTTIVTTRNRKKKVAKDDQPLADVFALEFPTGLSFDDAHKTASLKKFNAFLQQYTKAGAKAREHYEKMLQTGDPAAKVAATARMAQLFTRMASMLARAEIPMDLRDGDFAQDKMDAFCDRLAELAEPIEVMAEQAMSACTEQKKGLTADWWDTVCVKP